MSTELWRAAARILLGVVLLGAVLGAGLWLGSSQVHEQWRADAETRSAAEVDRAASSAAAYGRRAAQVIQAAEAVVAENAQLAAHTDALQGELHHARQNLLARHQPPAVVVRTPAGRPPAPDGLGVPLPAAVAAAPGDPDGPGGGSCVQPGDPVLSARAVSLWNRALGPSADPRAPAADPRSADAAASGPYSPDPADPDGSSGITLSDAWRNHLDNALSCAQDRVRLGRLQGWLRSLQPD